MELTRKKILVIDDDLAFSDFITSFLTQNGYSVLNADDGLTGLNIARAELPDLVITAVMLPKIDGLHVCRLLRFDEVYKTIPVVIICDEGTDVDESILKMVEANAFFTKPILPDEFMQKIQQVMERKFI